MSFNIVLKNNQSPSNAITKSLTDVATFTGTLKDGSSLVDPVVMVENSGAITGVNYATIADFGRSYFIKDIKNVYNNMWEISLHSDALSSFASEIRQCQCVAAKNQHAFNLYLNDDNYRCYQNPWEIQKVFPSGFSYANFSYVLALCAGKEAVS